MSETAQSQVPGRVETGVPGLDEITGGGLLPGGLYLILGKSGTGKTLLAHQIAFNRIAAGESVLYVTLLTETHTRMIGHLERMPFFARQQLARQFSYISGYHVWRDQGALGLMPFIRQLLKAHNPVMLVIDGLPLRVPDQAYDPTIDNFVHDLQAYCELTRSTALLLAPVLHDNPESLAFLLVDGVVELCRTIANNRAQRSLEILKFRASPYIYGPVPFQINERGVTIDHERAAP